MHSEWNLNHADMMGKQFQLDQEIRRHHHQLLMDQLLQICHHKQLEREGMKIGEGKAIQSMRA